MAQRKALDPRYTFFFVGDEGRSIARQTYWDALYVIPYRGMRVLVAARVVPHSSAQYALYEALKSGIRSHGREEALPEGGKPSHQVLASGSGIDPIEGIRDLLPELPIPAAGPGLEDEAERAMEAVSSVLANQGIARGLDAFTDPGEVRSLEERFADPADTLHTLAGSKGPDIGLIQLSFAVDATLKDRIRRILAESSPGTLVRHPGVEFDFSRVLYGNPRYLAFVKRLIAAQGSYISPVVRDFLGFYSRCLNARLNRSVRDEQIDPDLLQKHLESRLGRVKGSSHYYLHYHDLTILGYADDSDLAVDRDDPDQTGRCYKVHPGIDVGALVMTDIEGSTQRLLIRKLVEHTFHTHHNVKAVRYIDESPPEALTAPIKRSKPVLTIGPDGSPTMALYRGDEGRRARIVSALYFLAISAVVLVAVGVVAVILRAAFL